LGHVVSSLVPHCPQNFAPSGSSTSHSGHFMTSPAEPWKERGKTHLWGSQEPSKPHDHYLQLPLVPLVHSTGGRELCQSRLRSGKVIVGRNHNMLRLKAANSLDGWPPTRKLLNEGLRHRVQRLTLEAPDVFSVCRKPDLKVSQPLFIISFGKVLSKMGPATFLSLQRSIEDQAADSCSRAQFQSACRVLAFVAAG